MGSDGLAAKPALDMFDVGARSRQSLTQSLRHLEGRFSEKIYAIKADIFFFDGHGLAHPRGLGIASHVGVLLEIVTLGCAKKKLIGDFKFPENKRGSYSNLLYKGKIVGCVLRTKVNVKPIYISVGNKLKLEYLPKLTLDCTKKYRIPEPTRLAHLAVTNYKRAHFS